MKDKYNMTLEQSIFAAKRIIVDTIWKSANLEGISVTFPDTNTIFNGYSVAGYKVDDILAINNLKKAWYFILDKDTLSAPTDIRLIQHINKIVGSDGLVYNAGAIRKLHVNIGGTTWKPEIPNTESIIEGLNQIGKIENITEQAITLMLYLMRTQAFIDGNKRTAMIAANHLMVKNGKGIISIPIESQREFFGLLIQYYESNDNSLIKKFIFDTSIDGLAF